MPMSPLSAQWKDFRRVSDVKPNPCNHKQCAYERENFTQIVIKHIIDFNRENS